MFSSFFLLLLALTPAQGSASADLPSLLALATAPASPLDANQPYQIQRQHVRVDFSLLQTTRFRVPLFGGVELTATHRRSEQYDNGIVWIGGLAEDPAGDIFLSWVGGSLTGSVRYQDRLYRIAPAEDGPVYYLAKLDEKRFPECAATAQLGISTSQSKSGGNGNRAGNPDIDVMVVYTSLARSRQGGTNAMNSLINLAVSETNDGYLNSDVDQQLVLVHAYELVGYTENGNFFHRVVALARQERRLQR